MRLMSVCEMASRLPDDHRQRGQRPEDGRQVNRQGGEGGGEDAQQRGEARDLGARGHEGGDRGRRALVDVGRPHVERDSRDLEAESHQDERRANGQEQDRGRGGSEDARQAGGPGRAEDQRDAVDDKSRREGAEQEVFDARFLGCHHFAVEGREHVERDGEQFEGEEDDDEVRGLHHQHHAGHAEKQEDVVFAALDAHAFDVAKGKRDAEQAADEQQGVEEGGETVLARPCR